MIFDSWWSGTLIGALTTAAVGCGSADYGAVALPTEEALGETTSAAFDEDGFEWGQRESLELGVAESSLSSEFVFTSDGNALATIACNLNLERPHDSSHVDGTVNIISQIRCTAPVSAILQRLGLYRDAVLVSQTTNSNAGLSSLRTKTNAPCVPGIYAGLADMVITAPLGFEPPQITFTELTQFYPIDCN